MRYPNGAAVIGDGWSQSVGRKTNSGFPAVVGSDSVNKYRKPRVQSQVLPVYTEYVRSPCQQMAARVLLFVKFGPLVDHGKSISEDQFLVRVHIR